MTSGGERNVYIFDSNETHVTKIDFLTILCDNYRKFYIICKYFQ